MFRTMNYCIGANINNKEYQHIFVHKMRLHIHWIYNITISTFMTAHWLSLICLVVPTNGSELSRTERTRDVVHTGWRDDLGITAFSSSSSPFSPFFICNILSSCSYCSTSREERDRGWRRGGGGEDRFTIDCGDKRNRYWHVFPCVTTMWLISWHL